jgi:hypothetical protein
MVTKYTKRALTVPTDKLPALSGLANEYRGRKRRTNTYLAGIWSSTILQGLQWERAERNTVLARPLQYIAPSWPWAFVSGPVKYPVLTYFDTFRATVPLTKLTFHHILPASLLHPAGEVKNGHLVLETVLICVSLRQAELQNLTSRTGTGWRSSVYNVDLHLPVPSVHSSKPTYTALNDIVAHANFDFEDEAAALNPAESRTVMLLGRFTEDYGLPVTGLIVEPVPSPLTTFATQVPVSPPQHLDQADIAEQFSTIPDEEKLASQALSYLTGPEEDHAYEDFIELFSELPVYRRVGVMRFSKQEIPYQGRNYKKFEVLDQCVRERMIFV